MKTTKTLFRVCTVCMFCLCATVFPARAQFVVEDPLANQKLKSQLVKWIQDQLNQGSQKRRLRQILSEETTTRQKVEAILALKRDVEKQLYSAKDLRKLRISDLSGILRQAYGIGRPADFLGDYPYMSQYQAYASRGSSHRNAAALYDFMLAGTTAYAPSERASLHTTVENLRTQQFKSYGIHLAAQKRKLAGALAYRRIADQYTELAADLSRGATAEGEQRLTAGERIRVQNMANQYAVKAMELKAKADALTAEAMQKNETLEKVDRAYNSRLVVRGMSRTKL